MTWVKVCGLSRREEVAVAVRVGADAVGFNAIGGSPRCLPLGSIAQLAAGVPCRTILLTRDLTPEGLLAAVEQAGVDGVQPYGRHRVEAARRARDAGLFVLQPIRVGPTGEVGNAGRVAGAVPLFDTHRPGREGGTGQVFDWGVLRDVAGDFVVAGGLGPDNVGELVRRIRPWGVDASSRLESAPGVKDLGKVAAFIEEAKET